MKTLAFGVATCVLLIVSVAACWEAWGMLAPWLRSSSKVWVCATNGSLGMAALTPDLHAVLELSSVQSCGFDDCMQDDPWVAVGTMTLRRGHDVLCTREDVGLTRRDGALCAHVELNEHDIALDGTWCATRSQR